MTKDELYSAVNVLLHAAVNNCPKELWEQLEAHARANWAVSPFGLIEMALLQGFGLAID